MARTSAKISSRLDKAARFVFQRLGVFKPYYLLPIVVVLAWVWPRMGGRAFRSVARLLDRVALRPWRAILTVGLVSFTMCLAMGTFIRIPAPHTHDEYGYLLIADTLAHGRVANPPHPLWPHFESVHIMQQPTYASKYPPAQGLALAVGEKGFGLPIVGVWLTTALASATICWMLMGWVEPRWALFGGLLTALHPQMVVWSQAYWGGAVALGGGAIVLGAFRRILREPRARDALWLSTGMAILANSRPYEGFVFSLLICGTLAIWICSADGPSWRIALRRVALPVVTVMLLLAVQIGYYNYRITGSVLRMPYVVCEETYGIAPLFIFQKPKPEPEYRHREIQALQYDYLRYYLSQRKSATALIRSTIEKIYVVTQSALWSLLLAVPLLALPWAIRGDRWVRLSIPAGLFFGGAMMLGTWVSPHYAAPAGGLFMVLVVASFRQLRTWKVQGRPVGLALSRGVLLLCALSTVLTVRKVMMLDGDDWALQRRRILAELEQTPGSHLVFVHYTPNHNPHREWVYNSADIDGAKVVLARIMTTNENAQLCRYFTGRDLWMIEADASPATVRKLSDPAEIPSVARPVHGPPQSRGS